MRKFAFFSLFFAFLLISCASGGGGSSLGKVFVTNTTRVDVLPADAISATIDEYQRFDGKFGESEFGANLYLQADSGGIDILLLNELGIEMGSISYDGESARMDSSLFPEKLKCEYVILDLQNVYADFQVLKRHYKKYKLTFVEFVECPTEDSVPKTVRVLSKKNDEIERIEIQEGKISIKNTLRGYEYTLKTAE